MSVEEQWNDVVFCVCRGSALSSSSKLFVGGWLIVNAVAFASSLCIFCELFYSSMSLQQQSNPTAIRIHTKRTRRLHTQVLFNNRCWSFAHRFQSRPYIKITIPFVLAVWAAATRTNRIQIERAKSLVQTISIFRVNIHWKTIKLWIKICCIIFNLFFSLLILWCWNVSALSRMCVCVCYMFCIRATVFHTPELSRMQMTQI